MTAPFSEFVESNPDVRGGELVLKGTRVPLAQILAELAETVGVEFIAGVDPTLVRGAVESVAGELERLLAEREAFRLWVRGEVPGIPITFICGHCGDKTAKAEEMREHTMQCPDSPLVRKLERLEIALAPFAKAAPLMTAGKVIPPEEAGIWTDQTSGCRVTVADFQRAAEAVKEQESDG